MNGSTGRKSAVAAAAAIAAALCHPASAASPLAAVRQSAAEASDRQLRAFAAAAVAIQRISDRYRPDLDSTLDHQEQQRLRQAVQEEMDEAVRQQGLSLEDYRRIYGLIQADPRAKRIVVDHIRQLE